MGAVLSLAIKGLAGDLDRDQALAEADRRYADRWGAHTVVRRLARETESAVAGTQGWPAKDVAEGSAVE